MGASLSSQSQGLRLGWVVRLLLLPRRHQLVRLLWCLWRVRSEPTLRVLLRVLGLCRQVLSRQSLSAWSFPALRLRFLLRGYILLILFIFRSLRLRLARSVRWVRLRSGQFRLTRRFSHRRLLRGG